MSNTPLTSAHDQGATFVELFFDLVFVFAVSRLTHHFAHHITLGAVVPTLLVGWLLWWSWTQYTWALNAANTNRHDVRLVTLIATGIAFLMAASIDQAFGSGPFWFAVPYVVLRIVGLLLYDRIAGDEIEIRRGVRIFGLTSILGLAAVLTGAALDPPLRYWIWGVAMLCDVFAAAMAGRHKDWHLRVEHFAERHGLIVIIALGEALIVAGVGVAEQPRDWHCVISGVLATGATCLLWWTYFGWAKDAIEHGTLQAAEGAQVEIARDSYSLWHFPLVFGIITFAAGLVEISAHIQEDAPPAAVYAMASGLVLFVGSTAAALRRATGVLTIPRLALLAATAAGLSLTASRPTTVALATACIGLALVVGVEHVRPPSCKLAAARGRQHLG